jgi:hypothetical protein
LFRPGAVPTNSEIYPNNRGWINKHGNALETSGLALLDDCAGEALGRDGDSYVS